MIPRYSTPETDALFSDEGRMARWIEIELSVVEAMEATGTFQTAASTADSGWRALPAPTGVAASDAGESADHTPLPNACATKV